MTVAGPCAEFQEQKVLDGSLQVISTFRTMKPADKAAVLISFSSFVHQSTAERAFHDIGVFAEYLSIGKRVHL